MPPLTDLQNSGVLADDTKSYDGDRNPTHEPGSAPHPDFPPESFWVSATDELDWLHKNTFIQRKGSVKFAITKNFDPDFKPSRRSFSFNNNKPKVSIFGHAKAQKFTYVAGKANSRQIDNRKLFRSRSESGKDQVRQFHEPVSPNVSCMGRVGSRKRCSRKRFGFWATVRASFVSRVRKDRCKINRPLEPVAGK